MIQPIGRITYDFNAPCPLGMYSNFSYLHSDGEFKIIFLYVHVHVPISLVCHVMIYQLTIVNRMSS